MPSTLQRKVRAALRAAADPARAPAMQAYMKSVMPFHGVPAPRLRALCRELLAGYDPADAETWRDDVLTLWREARHREERYVAIAVARHRAAKRFRTIEALPVYEEMIVTGAWWDYVDTIASHLVGGLLRAAPEPMRRRMVEWSSSPDLWKRRTAILCQLGSGAATDVALLHACIEPSLSSKEFFLRKAIGWALRQRARHAPAEVARYVAEHAEVLSGLTKREALKHVRG